MPQTIPHHPLSQKRDQTTSFVPSAKQRKRHWTESVTAHRSSRSRRSAADLRRPSAITKITDSGSKKIKHASTSITCDLNAARLSHAPVQRENNLVDEEIGLQEILPTPIVTGDGGIPSGLKENPNSKVSSRERPKFRGVRRESTRCSDDTI